MEELPRSSPPDRERFKRYRLARLLPLPTGAVELELALPAPADVAAVAAAAATALTSSGPMLPEVALLLRLELCALRIRAIGTAANGEAMLSTAP